MAKSYPCENCKLRANYEKNPKSLMGRFWRWHINFCPGSQLKNETTLLWPKSHMERMCMGVYKKNDEWWGFITSNDIATPEEVEKMLK